MARPSRGRTCNQNFVGSGTTLSNLNNYQKYFCYCGLEVIVLIIDDNYRQ